MNLGGRLLAIQDTVINTSLLLKHGMPPEASASPLLLLERKEILLQGRLNKTAMNYSLFLNNSINKW